MGTAAAKFIKFMEEGHYPLLTHLKKKKKEVNIQLRNQLQDREENRFLFEKHGVVAKFVRKGVYHTDYPALNEYLFDKGLLPFLVEVEGKKVKKHPYWEEELEEFQQPLTYFVQPYFNKKGKALNLQEAVPSMNEWNAEQLISIHYQTSKKLEQLQSSYQALKKEMLHCKELKKKKKVMHDYGSLKLREQEITYDNHAIFHELGSDVLIEYGKPNARKMERFLEKGLISNKEINAFKTLVDYRSDFLIMTVEAEQNMFEHFHKRNVRISLEQQKRAQS